MAMMHNSFGPPKVYYWNLVCSGNLEPSRKHLRSMSDMVACLSHSTSSTVSSPFTITIVFPFSLLTLPLPPGTQLALPFEDDGIERFRLWLRENAEAPTADVLEELRAIQTFAALRPSDRIIIFMGAVFTADAVSKNEVNTHKETLAALAPSAIQQRHLIAAVEWFCGSRTPSLLRYFPVMLKHAYDLDLIDEEPIIEWSRAPIRNDFSAEASMISEDTLEELKKSAEPFITWLEEAESDDDDDDNEDD